MSIYISIFAFFSVLLSSELDVGNLVSENPNSKIQCFWGDSLGNIQFVNTSYSFNAEGSELVSATILDDTLYLNTTVSIASLNSNALSQIDIASSQTEQLNQLVSNFRQLHWEDGLLMEITNERSLNHHVASGLAALNIYLGDSDGLSLVVGNLIWLVDGHVVAVTIYPVGPAHDEDSSQQLSPKRAEALLREKLKNCNFNK